MMVRRRIAGCLAAGVLCLTVTACARGPEASSALPPVDVAGPPPDAVVAPSGLASRLLAAGHGSRHPAAHSRVVIHYTGWTTDGTVVEEAPETREPAAFEIEQLIPGLQEGVRLMVEGEKRRFWIPPSLAYEGQPNRPQGMLVYDVTLVRCVD